MLPVVTVIMGLESRFLPRRQPVPHGDRLGVVALVAVVLLVLLAFRLVGGGWHQHCFFIKIYSILTGQNVVFQVQS